MPRISVTEKQRLYEELSKLLHAGFHIKEASRVLRESALSRGVTSILEQMDAALLTGKSIADFFADAPGVTEMEHMIIRAGERGGRLAGSFDHLSQYFSLLVAARKQAVSALVYPFFLLHLGILAGALPLVLKGAGGIGKYLTITFLTAYICGISLFFLVKYLLNAAKTNAAIDQLLNRIPFIGKARRMLAMARFTKVYHIGLLAALPMEEVLSGAAKASQSGEKIQGTKSLLEIVRAGGFLGPGFIASSAFPKGFSTSYSVGEQAGTLDIDLQRFAILYQEEAILAMRKLSVAIPKAIYILIVAFIIWQIIRFYGSYLSELETIGNDE